MASKYYTKGTDFTPGSRIRSETVNDELSAIETGFESVESEITNQALKFPLYFSGNTRIPDKTLDNSLVYINSSGDLDALSKTDFDTDVADVKTLAAEHRAAEETVSEAADLAQSAIDARNKAQQWAEAPVGEYVEVGCYSAMHWAEEAKSHHDAVVGTGITDAPADNKRYSRYNGTWTEVDTFPEAPTDGTQYVRQDGGWQPVVTAEGLTVPIGGTLPESAAEGEMFVDEATMVMYTWLIDADGDGYWVEISGGGSAGNGTVDEAPSTGSIYGRGNGAWRVIDEMAEAPTDSLPYVRVDGGWVSFEAPLDNKVYARQLGAWVEVDISGSGIGDEAPEDDLYYARRNAAWESLPTPLDDAPSDSNDYVRRNGAWQSITGGSSVSEAPADGTQYARVDNAWQAVSTVPATSGPANILIADSLPTSPVEGERVLIPRQMTEYVYVATPGGTPCWVGQRIVSSELVNSQDAYEFEAVDFGPDYSTSTSSGPYYTHIANNGGSKWMIGGENATYINAVKSEVLRSTDDGNTWYPIDFYAATGLYTVEDVSIMLGDGEDALIGFFKGTGDPRIYRTTDFGATWTSIDPYNDIPIGAPNDAPTAGVVTDAGTWIIARGDGHSARSTDKGVTWTALPLALNSGGGYVKINSFACLGAVVVAGLDDGFAAISTDDGVTWAALTRGLNSGYPTGDIESLTAHGTVFIAGFAQGYLARSMDNGATWNALAKQGSATYTYHYLSTGRLYSSIGRYSDDDGTNFYNSLISMGFYSVADNGTQVMAAGKYKRRCGWQAPLTATDGWFPVNPGVGDRHSVGQTTYTFDGLAWIAEG